MNSPLLFLHLLLLFRSSAASCTEGSPNPREHCTNNTETVGRCPHHLTGSPSAANDSSSQPQPAREEFSAEIGCGGGVCICHLIRVSAINGSIINASGTLSLPLPSEKLANASAVSSLAQIYQGNMTAISDAQPPQLSRSRALPKPGRKLGFFVAVGAAGPSLPTTWVPSPPPPPGQPPPIFMNPSNNTRQIELAPIIFLLYLLFHLIIL